MYMYVHMYMYVSLIGLQGKCVVNFDLPQIVDIPDNNGTQQPIPISPVQQSTAFQYAVTDILPAENEKKNKAVCSYSHNYCK